MTNLPPAIERAFVRTVAHKLGTYPAARALGITPSALQRYVDGEVAVPHGVFLRALDVVLNHAYDVQPLAGGARNFGETDLA